MKLKNFDLDAILTSPLVLWIISITAAIMMWVYVTAMDESSYITRKFSTPLEYRSLDSQAVLRGQVYEVDVELRGPEDEMLRLDYNSVNAYIDARNLTPGKRYTVGVNVSVPGNVVLTSCFPSQITLDLVREISRLMSVETVLPQDLPEGNYIEGVEIIPKEVGIRGAEDDIAKVGSVRVTPTFDELLEGRELLLPVKFSQSEPFNGTVAIEPPQVRFRGNLVRGLPRKRVPVNVRLSGELDEDYQVRSIVIDPSEILIEGSKDVIAAIEAVDTEIIDVSGLASNKVIVTPLKLPEKVSGSVSFIGASSVKVSIQLSEARAEKMLTNIPVLFRNTDSPQNWTSSPANVSVTVEGKPSLIESFGVEQANIIAYADMSNIFMAPVVLPVRTEILSSDEFRIVRVEPQNVTINALTR